MNHIKNFLIRVADINDMDKIEKVMKISMASLGLGYYKDEQIQACCQYVCVPDKQIIEDGTYYVVEDENHDIIACGGWSFRNTLYAGPQQSINKKNRMNPQKDKARIRAMFVLPEMSGHGIGSLILKTAEEAAKAYGFKQGALGATQSGLAFYQIKGWKSVKSEIALLPNGVSIEVTHMEKDFC